MSKVLIRKQQGIQYQQMIDAPQQRSSLGRDLAALRGGAVGVTPQGGQGFVSGQGQAGRPTRMQRLGAGANLAGRGLAAALTGLQTAHSLQGGNLGAVASARDQYRANVGGLTGGQPTEMQRTQDMATEMYNTQEQERLQQQIRDAAQQQMASQVPAGMPPQRQENVPLPTSMPNRNPAGPSRVAINPPQQLTGPPVSTPSQTIDDPSLPPREGPIPLPTAQSTAPTAPTAQPAALPADNFPPTQMAGILPSVQMETPANSTTQMTTNQFTENPLQLAPATPLTSANVVSFSGVPEMRVGQGQEEEEEIDPRTGRPKPDFRDTPTYLKSFNQMIFNEFDDVLHKADPHVAGLLAFRVYMDKIMR